MIMDKKSYIDYYIGVILDNLPGDIDEKFRYYEVAETAYNQVENSISITFIKHDGSDVTVKFKIIDNGHVDMSQLDFI